MKWVTCSTPWGMPDFRVAHTLLLLIATLFPRALVAQAAPANQAAAQEAAQDSNEPQTQPPVATYKGGEITADELRARLAQIPPQIRAHYLTPEGRKELLDQAIEFELLAIEAKRRGYDKDERVMQQVKRAATQKYIREHIDNKLTREQVSEEEVATYYKAHEREFNVPEQRRGSRILVKSEDEATALISELSKKDLRAFRQTAQRKSLDEGTKLRGGDLRYFDLEGLDVEGKPTVSAELAKAAFALKMRGDIYPTPIKTNAGFSVFMLTGIRPRVERPIDAVAELIRGRLLQQKRKDALDALIAKLKTELKPKVHAELISLIQFKEDGSGPVPPSRDLPKGFPEKRPAAQNHTSEAQGPQK